MSDKLKIYLFTNPFDTEQREILNFEYDPDTTVQGYLVEQLPVKDGVEFICAINGTLSSLDTVPNSGDKIVVSAQTQVEGTVGAWIATVILGAGAAGTIAYTAIAIAANMLISYGMGQLIGALGLGPEKPDLGSVGSDSPKYSWGALRQMEGEGNPIPIIFGTHKVAGQVINKYIKLGTNENKQEVLFRVITGELVSGISGTSSGDGYDGQKEYLYILLVVNDGQVDSISDIRINEQPVENYKGITTHTRLGTLNDDPIPGFSEIVTHRTINSKITPSYTTIQTDGNAVNKIVIDVTAPRGLSYSNDDGGLDEVSVNYSVEYKAVSASTWNTSSTQRITGATTSSIRNSVTIDGLSPDQYEVRINRGSSESTDFRKSDSITLANFKEIVDEELIYPGIAKYAIEALATDQLSGGVPAISCKVTKNSVSIYNPNTESWESRSANNPAWAAWYLLNHYHKIHYTRLIYSDFDEWATYCNDTIDGEQRHKIGIVFDVVSNAWENVQRIAQLGRGVIIRKGSKYGVFVDKQEFIVTDLFSMGNIIEESFSMNYLPQKDRANAVEITYVDPDRDYSNQVLGVYSDDYRNPTNPSQKANIKINAAVSRSWAIREATFRLNNNKYLTKTIEFEASIDSIACVVGDLIYFQHMVPHYSDSNSGRIVAAGGSYVQLDQEVTLEVGVSYAILVRFGDNSMIEKSLQAIASTHTTDTLLLSTDWTEAPIEYDLYVFGEASTYKKTYRVTDITRAQELTRNISCLEYVDAIYTDDPYVIETPTWGEAVLQEAVTVSADEFLTVSKAGEYQSNIKVSWLAASENSGSNWDIWLVDETLNRTFIDDAGGVFEADTFEDTTNEAGVWHIARTTDMQYKIGPEHLVQNHEYIIYVVPYGSGATSTDGNTTHIQILGKLAPPDDLVVFNADWDVVKRTINFTWDKVGNIDVSHYEIRDGVEWDGAGIVYEKAKGNSASFFIEEGTDETKTYLIKAVDNSGIYSINAASVSLEVDTGETPLVIPTSLTLSSSQGIASDGTDRVTILATWDSNAEASLQWHHYLLLFEEISSGNTSTYNTEETQYQWEVMPNKSYGIAVAAVDKGGNRTFFSTQETILSTKDSSPPAIPTWQTTPLIAGFKVIGLRWIKNTEDDLSFYEAQRSTTGAFTGEEIDLGDKDGNFTTDTDLDVSATYYYRIRAVDTSGNASDWSTIENATTLQVGESDIAYNAITANHISATNVSGVFASFGIMTAGVIESSNWSTTDGMRIDLDNEVLEIGGSDNPNLSWDGITLSVEGNVVITGGTGALNLSDGPAEAGANITETRTSADTSAVNGTSSSTIISGGLIQTGVLTANNIQTGILDASLVRVSSGDGRTYFDGNTIYVYDDNGNLRVEMGAI